MLDALPITLDFTVVSITVAVLHLIAIAAVLLQERRAPSTTLAWLLALVFMPGVGLLVFLLLGSTRLRRVARQSAVVAARIDKVLATHGVRENLGARQRDLDPRTLTMLRLGDHLTTTPASQGNGANILVNGAATYRAMIAAIEAARDHLHLEFYIIQPDRTGASLRDRLVKRVAAGIEVRVLYDAIGSLALPNDFWQPLLAAGGQAAAFRPVRKILYRLRQRDRIDFRNHRKIVVVDGEVGFCGGINVGREYLGLDPNIGHWRDTHIQIRGPAVLSLQETFAEDWYAATGELVDDSRYFPAPPADNPGDCVVQVVDSGPDRTWSPITHLFTQAFALARERIWITNPYFVPSAVVEMALHTAALRGIDVRLLLPRRADHFLVTLASHSYFADLLAAGIRIFEYERGFVHAKTMLVDNWIATVGSANMDMRSFHLNFELNAFVYSDSFATAMAKQFLADLAAAREVSEKAYTDPGYLRRLGQSAARLLSPLL